MTPGQKVNLETWDVLQKIKEESLVPDEDGIFFYNTTKTVIATGKPSPTRERKWAIVRKLARKNAIKIIEEIKPDWRGGRNGFYLKILEPKFGKTYEKYKIACDLTSYLNDYQEKMFKDYNNLPEFAQVEFVNDKKGARQVSPRKKHKGQMFPTGSGGGEKTS